MSGPSREGQGLSASEEDVAEALSGIRLHEERWDEYRRAMRQHTSRFEEAATGLGATNYFVQKGLAARKELDSYVGQLAFQQTELLTEATREINSASEQEAERLVREKGGV